VRELIKTIKNIRDAFQPATYISYKIGSKSVKVLILR